MEKEKSLLMDQQKSNLEQQRNQLANYDKDKVIPQLTDDFINSFKRQIQDLKDHLDLKTTQNKALHDK